MKKARFVKYPRALAVNWRKSSAVEKWNCPAATLKVTFTFAGSRNAAKKGAGPCVRTSKKVSHESSAVAMFASSAGVLLGEPNEQAEEKGMRQVDAGRGGGGGAE